MVYARVQENTVVEIMQPLPGFTVEQCFHADLLAACAQMEGAVQVGWVRQEDGTFAAPAETLPAEATEELVTEELVTEEPAAETPVELT